MEGGTFSCYISHISVKIGKNSELFLLINEVIFLVQFFLFGNLIEPFWFFVVLILYTMV